MTLTLAEGAVETLRALFETSLADTLATVEARYPDRPLTLPMPALYDHETDEVPENEALFILVQDNDLTQRGGGPSGWVMSRPSMLLGILLTDGNSSNLTRRLYRYTEALIDLLITSEAGAGLPFVVTALTVSYSPTLTDGSQQFVADAALRFNMARQELVI